MRSQMTRKTTGQRRTNKKTTTKKFILRNPGDYTDKIYHRAYEIYLQRGNELGDALTDWLQAEREVKEKYSVA